MHLGAQDIYDEAEPNRQIVTTRDATAHQNYNPNTINNDIAVIRMSQGVSGTGIGPVRLPSRSQAGETFTGERVRVSGWGRTSDCKLNHCSFSLISHIPLLKLKCSTVLQ